MNHFQAQLERAFEPSSDAQLIRGMGEGILLADKLMESDRILASLIGMDLRGQVRRAGILLRIHEMTQSGDLPFTSTMTRMERGNWHWIEIISKSVRAHICRTDGPELFPRDTPTRQDDRFSNQPDLFKAVDDGKDIAFRCAWLMFAAGDAGNLSHLCWGMPSAYTDEWLGRVNILRRAEKAQLEVKVEAPSRSSKLKFREHIEEGLLENKKIKAANGG